MSQHSLGLSTLASSCPLPTRPTAALLPALKGYVLPFQLPPRELSLRALAPPGATQGEKFPRRCWQERGGDLEVAAVVPRAGC